MPNKLIKQITTSSKLLMLLFLVFIIILAKSLFLNLSLIVLFVVFVIIQNSEAKKIINVIKKTSIFLLIIMIIYMLVFQEIITITIFTYKFLLIIIYTYIILKPLDFNMIDGAINKLFSIMIKSNLKNKLSFQITLAYYYILHFLESCGSVIKRQQTVNKLDIGTKYFLIPVLMLTELKTKRLEQTLLLNLYEVKKEENNCISVFVCLLFLLMLIITVFKEVII